MNTRPLIAEIAALVGDPARATMLTALLDRRALTASELAYAARITPQTARLCLDWTERRPRIGGAVGAALTKRYFDLGWTERMKHSSAVVVTKSGRRGFRETFGISVPEENETAPRTGREKPFLTSG